MISYIGVRLFPLLLATAGLIGDVSGALADAPGPEASPVPVVGPAAAPAPTPRPISASAPVPQVLARLEALAAQRPYRTPDAPGAEPSPALSTRLAPLVDDLNPAMSLGLHVWGLEAKTPLFDFAGDLALNPASNHKLLTAAAALELLGPEHRFETQVWVDGDTLVLVGSGDPSLQVPDLAALAGQVRTLADAGQLDLGSIHRIVIDDTLFSPRRFGPGYDEDGYGPSYMAPSGALSVQWNTVEVRVDPGPPGGPVRVRVTPPCDQVDVVVTATTGRGRGLGVESHRRGDKTVLTVHGHLPATGAPWRGRRRIHNPGRFVASVFAEHFGALGRTWEISPGRREPGATLIATHRSPPLAEVLDSALKYSNNFTAEQLLRVLGHHGSGEGGDWVNGAEILRRFWAATGQDPAEVRFENAAGFSPHGRLSARAITRLLAWTLRPGSRSADLIRALAVAGQDGTLRHRLGDTGGRVLAKTGTLENASALSGVVLGADGRPTMVFSVLVNGPDLGGQAHALQDRVVRALLSPT